MKRRSFLGLAASSALWPAFVQRAFAAEGPGIGVEHGVDDVGAAFRRAARRGKPLLILVIPADDSEKYTRGEVWGEVLNHGSDDALAAFALAEVVCATTAAMKRVVPAAPAGEPLFVLVETARIPAPAAGFTADLPAYDQIRRYDSSVPWEERLRREKETSLARIRALGALVGAAVFGSVGERLAGRVAQAEAALSAEDKRALAAILERVSPSPPPAAAPAPEDLALVDRAAALVAAAGPDGVALAARAARARIVDKPPRGAKWAHGGGCGVRVEGDDDNVGIACGMGHTPELAQRFLYFFTKGPYE